MSESAPRVAGGAAWNLLYVSAVRAATFAVSVLVARILGPTGVGGFGIALQLSGLLGAATGLNLAPALTRRLAKAESARETRRLLTVALCLVLAAATVTLVGVVSFAAPIAERAFGDGALAPIIAWSGPLAVATALMVLTESSFQGARRFDTLALWGIGLSVADLSACAVAAPGGVVPILIVRSIVRIAALGVAVALWQRWLARLAHDAPSGAGSNVIEAPTVTARALLAFALPALLSTALAMFGQTALRSLLVHATSLDEAGLFQAADTVGQALLLVPAAAAAAYLPAVARDTSERPTLASSTIIRAFKRVSGFNLPLCLALLAGSAWIVPLVFGPAFSPAVPVLAILTAAYALSGLCMVGGAVFLGRGEVWTGVALNALWLAALIAGFAVIAHEGARAAALALLGAYGLLFLTILALVHRRLGVALRSFASPLAAHVAVVVLALVSASGRAPLSWIAGLAVAGIAGSFLAWGLPALRSGDLSLRRVVR